jgi:DNA polymerase-3 subunit epsilon
MSLLGNGVEHDRLTAMSDELVASGDFRVLRRLPRRTLMRPYDGSATRRGLFVDVETTGLDPIRDEIIELALVPFVYGLDGCVFGIEEPYEALREPTVPISASITSLTGITAQMVAGKCLDSAVISTMAAAADLVVAHNSAFDRRFLERLDTTFAMKPWACSMCEIDWRNEGHEGVKLAYLAMGAGFFYDRHRAANDCRAAIELLAAPLPSTGKPAMERLLHSARRATWRIWAENAPFARKDELKACGYRWNAEGIDGPKSWYIDVDDEDRQTQLQFLRSEIYRRDVEPKMRRLTAYERFSSRTGPDHE